MISDVEDAIQTARDAADQAQTTATNAMDPEKEVSKEDLIAAIRACTEAANKASADADAAQAKAKATWRALSRKWPHQVTTLKQPSKIEY
jgi:ABC-type transporter Mla subunit MlaD